MDPSYSITGKELQERRRPFVYVWKRRDVVLYIGKSNYGFARLCKHEVIAPQVLAPDDEIQIFHVLNDDLQSILLLERELILALRPTLNKEGWYRTPWSENPLSRTKTRSEP